MLEREDEVERFDGLLSAALRGAGSTILIEGPAGIGKSELLGRVRDLAAERDMETLVARGGELERELPFVVVRTLLAGLVERASDEDRGELMAGAAALAGPVLTGAGGPGSTRSDGAASLTAALHGLFWLCSNLTDRRPLVLVVDDVHWADAGSLRFLSYLAHRIADLPAVLALGRRTGEPGIDDHVFAAIRAEPSTTTIEPAPLSRAAVAALLQTSYAAGVAEPFAAACHTATGGNPYLLRELVVALREGHVEPRAEQVGRVDEVRPRGVALAVRARLDRLPPPASELARAVAVLGVEVELRDAAKLARIPDDTAQEAADALAHAGLIEARRPLAFTHPLIRGAIYDDLPPGRRATAHARAAQQLLDAAAPSENVAAHLLHTEPAEHEGVVELLREAAAISMERGAPEQAVSYLRRALLEGPPPDRRLQLLRELGAAEIRAGEHSAVEHLLGALALAPQPDRPAIAEEASIAMLGAARREDAVALLHREIAATEATDRDTVLRLDAGMLGAALLSGTAYPGRQDLVARLRSLHGGTPGERLLLANGSYHLLLHGGGADDALAFARRAFATGSLLHESGIVPTPFWLAALAFIATGRYEDLQPLVEEAEREAARAGSVIGRALALHYRAMSAFQRGSIADAVEDEREALRITGRAEAWAARNHVLAVLTLALVERGDPAGAERVLGDHGVGGELPQELSFDYLRTARARLALAQGRPADALEDLRAVERHHEQYGLRSAWMLADWRPLAARALAAVGERDAAQRTADEQLRIARTWGAPGQIAAALRAQAAAAQAATRIDLLGQARATLEGTAETLERMHVLLELGTEQRHARRHSEAREPLLEALELAEPRGAALVAERARAELAATGITRRRRTFLAGVEALTPSERRVADMAAAGMSNPEIAQSLFVTRKTVEKHLVNAYAKLGISARGELSRVLG